MNFTKLKQSIKIFYGYCLLSALFIFCTFWLFDFEDFGGIAVGYASFFSAFVVLTRFAEIIVRSPDKMKPQGLRGWYRLCLGGFFKFLFPPLAIFWGTSRDFSPGFMVVGAICALSGAAAVLWLCERRDVRAIGS